MYKKICIIILASSLALSPCLAGVFPRLSTSGKIMLGGYLMIILPIVCAEILAEKVRHLCHFDCKKCPCDNNVKCACKCQCPSDCTQCYCTPR